MRQIESKANSSMQGLVELFPDGGAALRQFAANRGCELGLLESSETSCTVRARSSLLDSQPLVVTFTAEDVQRADLDDRPEWLAHPQRFLAAWATRDAAGWHLSDVVFDFEEARLFEPFGVPLELNATRHEYIHQLFGLTDTLNAYRQRRTLPGPFPPRVHDLMRRLIPRLARLKPAIAIVARRAPAAGIRWQIGRPAVRRSERQDRVKPS